MLGCLWNHSGGDGHLASTTQQKALNSAPKRIGGQPITERQHDLTQKKAHLDLNPEPLQLKNPTPPHLGATSLTPLSLSLSHGTSPETLVPK